MKKRSHNLKTSHNKSNVGYQLRDIILGGQDGIVNVLGVVLTVAEATNTTNMVLIAGLAATFAESLSMGAVAYTSSKAVHDYYQGRLSEEQRAVTMMPQYEIQKIRSIYANKGFRGKILQNIVHQIITKKKLWIQTLMVEEQHLFPEEYQYPLRNATVVGIASLIGSFIPLLPFFLFPVSTSVLLAFIASTLTLFVTGAIKAKLTIGHWLNSGMSMAMIGILAAVISYFIGKVLGIVLL